MSEQDEVCATAEQDAPIDLTITDVTAQKERWEGVLQDLHTRAKDLQQQQQVLETQTQQIHGAIQACDVFLQQMQRVLPE